MVRENEGHSDNAEAVPLMRLGPGERFFKFYILSEPGARPEQRLEHRIITKEHADGSLEMVSYNAWVANGHSEKHDVIRVPSLSKELLDKIVQRLRAEAQVPPEAFREVDLSGCDTVEEQLHLLAKLGI
jgi:hypothetical protein